MCTGHMLELHTTGNNVNNHGVAADMREREREREKGSPSVLVFCQGVPIDLLNLCDWNKCKWR